MSGYITTVFGSDTSEQEEFTYETAERTYWDFDDKDRLNVYLTDNTCIATHEAGSYEAVSCEENDDDDA